MTDVHEVIILTVRLIDTCLYWDLLLGSIFKKICSSFKCCKEFLVLPGRNNFNTWHECIITQFKSYLVISFTRCPVCDSGSAFSLGNLYLLFCNQWPGQSCTKEVSVFINCICHNSFKNIPVNKFPFQICNNNF